MSKKVLGFQIVITFFIIALSFSTVVAQPPWKEPWQETKENINTLIQDGFEITGTTVTPLSKFGHTGLLVEMIYLQKKKKLYRCTTFMAFEEGLKAAEGHVCEILITPDKHK